MGDLPMLRPVTQRAAVRVRCGLLHHRVYPFDMEGVPRFILSDRYTTFSLGERVRGLH